jgi:hypothetical protein
LFENVLLNPLDPALARHLRGKMGAELGLAAGLVFQTPGGSVECFG